MSIATSIVKLGVASVAIPGIGFVIGIILSRVIPGCHCDEGAGCGGCMGFDGLIELLIFGGFVGALGAFIVVLPASLVLAGIIGFFSKPEPRAISPADITDAVCSVVNQYRLSQPRTQRCPACDSEIAITTVGHNVHEAKMRIKMSCACGGFEGTYDIEKQA